MLDGLDSLQSKRVGLALSGGAVRGLAHIGVIKALQELGIKPTVITGTSVGSIIGAALAAGFGWQEIAEIARSVFWPSLLQGKKLEQFCHNHLPESFGDLEHPFAAIATALPDNEPVTITAGPLSSAISASCALRLFRRPVLRDGLRLKDGGFSCVLPARVCCELGAEFVIGSDVWEWSSLMRWLGNSPNDQRRWMKAYPAHYRSALSHTDIHIHPQVPTHGYLPSAAAVDRMISIGERAACRAMELFSPLIAA